MPYVPALDGLRGVAVVAVLLYHQGYGWARGGFLGVSLFFTLSGFLITTLVLNEHEATGRVRLGRFWARRVRRLAPAGLFGIGLALVALVVAVPAAQQASAAVDIRAALVQMANWRFILAGAPYADIGTVPSPVLHYWSLAIEEQFYLVFPLLALLTLRRGRGTLAVVLGAAALASLGAQLVLSGDRVYLGTETRAAELAIGCLLALAWQSGRRHAISRRVWDLVGLVALAVSLVMWVVVRQSDPVLLGGGLVLVAVVSAVLIAGTMGGSALPRGLALAPLRFIGLISYGLYVVHFPLFLILSPARTGLAGTSLFVLRVAVSISVATLLYLLVERPIREGHAVLVRHLRGLPASTLVVNGLVVLAIATVPLVPRGSATNPSGIEVLAVSSDPRPRPSVLPTPSSSPGPGDAPSSGPSAAPSPSPTGTVADARSSTPSQRPEGAPVEPHEVPTETAPSPPPVPTRPPRVVLVGDSTARGIGLGLQQWASSTASIEVSVVTSSGCAVLSGPRARYRVGYEFTPTGCGDLFHTAIREATRIDADAILVFIGSAQLADWRFDDDPEWRNINEPDIRDAYIDRLEEVVDELRGTGIPVLWADVPVPAWDLDRFGEIVGAQLPGSGQTLINDPVRTKNLNAYTTDVLDAKDGATVVAFVDGLAGPDGDIGEGDRVDGLHLSQAQVAAAADSWFFPRVVAAWTSAWDERGAPVPAEVAWPLPANP